MVTNIVSCSPFNAAEMTQLPEMVNQENGLREVRLRRFDCLHLIENSSSPSCADNEEIIEETPTSQTGQATSSTTKTPNSSNPSDKSNLRINELTPWLKQQARTIVNPSVMFNDQKEEIYIHTYLRMYDTSTSKFKNYKYEFKANLKNYRRRFEVELEKTDYLTLIKTASESKEVVNTVIYCYDAPICKDVTVVFSYLNYNLDKKSFIDSRSFRIDQREPDITAKNALPNQTERTIIDPEYQDGEDDTANDGAATHLDHSDDAFTANPGRGPILPPDSKNLLCEGLTIKGEDCPTYLVDSTLAKPDQSDSMETDLVKIYDTSETATVAHTDPNEMLFPDEQSLLNPGYIRQSEPGLKDVDPTASQIEVLVGEESKNENNADSEEEFVDVSQIRSETTEVVTELDGPSSYHQFILRERLRHELSNIKDTEKIVSYAPTQSIRPQPRKPHEPSKFPTGENPIQLVNPNGTSDLGLSQSPTRLDDAYRPQPPAGRALEAPSLDTLPNVDKTLLTAITQSKRPVPRPNRKVNFTSIDGRFNYDLSKCAEHLAAAKNVVYKQSRGEYWAGSLRNATHFGRSQYDTIITSSGHTDSQYSSTVTKEVIQFTACVLEQRYDTKLNNRVNSFSSKNGGQLGRHGSHQNGLDVDISYPHINGRTSGFDNFAGNMTEERVVAAFDQARLMLYTDRVHILLTDNRIRKKFCSYLRSNNKLRGYRPWVERYMYHVDGHHNHFHVRAKCSGQIGCVPQGEFANDNICG